MAHSVAEADIANSCFSKIGVKKKIVSFDDGTPAANFASARYAEIRDEMLRAHNWNFAKKRAKLAQLATGPVVPVDWKYYQLPDDWIRTIGIHDNDAGVGSIEWYAESGKISAGREELWITYVSEVTDPNQMTPDFREVVAYAMAIEAAIELVSSRSLSERMEARWETKMLKAMGTDAQGDGPRSLPRGSWVTRRFQGTSQVASTSS